MNLNTLYQTIFRNGKKILGGSSYSDELIPVEGGRIWYKKIGDGSKTPLVVIHGGPGFPHDYLLPLADPMLGRSVIFYDQLGCGRSERPENTSFWRVERFADELRTLCKFLKLDSVHLLGHSWGSIVALECAFGVPRVESLILASPCINIERWMADSKLLRAQLPAATQQALNEAESSGDFQSAAAKQAETEYYQRFVYGVHPYEELIELGRAGFGADCYHSMWGPNEFILSGSLMGYDNSAALKRVERPVLCTCGRFDEARPETTEWYASLAPHGQSRIFELSAHMPHLNETRAYVQAIAKFLNDADSKR